MGAVDSETAIRIAGSLGFSVFPVNRDKTPRVMHWRIESSSDPDAIALMWHGKRLFLATDCGKSEITVVDVDDHDRLDPKVARTVVEYPTLVLPSLNRKLPHHYYRGVTRSTRFNGGDLISEGKYAVLSGEPPIQDRPIAALPDELRMAPRPDPVLPDLGGEFTPYGIAALERHLGALYRAEEGERNITLNCAAFAVGQLIATGELSKHALDELHVLAIEKGLTEEETVKTIRSGAAAGTAQPWRKDDNGNTRRPLRRF